MFKIVCIVLFVIANQYHQFPIVTLMSISITNLMTAVKNLYNSFVMTVFSENKLLLLFSRKNSLQIFGKGIRFLKYIYIYIIPITLSGKKNIPSIIRNVTGLNRTIKSLIFQYFLHQAGLLVFLRNHQFN